MQDRPEMKIIHGSTRTRIVVWSDRRADAAGYGWGAALFTTPHIVQLAAYLGRYVVRICYSKRDKK